MNIFKKTLLTLLNKEIADIKRQEYSRGHYTAIIDHEQNKREQMAKNDLLIMRADVGTKVVYCSNEWEDPLFGIIINVIKIKPEHDPLYVVQEALSLSHCYCHKGSLYLADEKMVDAILKLNPFERWNMNLAKGYLAPHLWEKCYPPQTELTDPAVLKQKLKEANFI